MPGYDKAVDGDLDTQYETENGYGNWHSGESFFLSKDGYTAYIAGGAIVQGSICADEVSNLTVKGRGIQSGQLTIYAAERRSTLPESE